MKSKMWFHILAVCSISLLLLSGCEKGKEPTPPTLTTKAISGITTNSAISGGSIDSDGGFEVTARGVCWDTVSDPDISDYHTLDGTGIGSFESFITGLLPGIRYYVRAYATNSGGTAYGNKVFFTTFPEFTPIIFNAYLTYDSVSDIEGNIYKTILIGTQNWLAENLKTTTLNDGNPIPEVTYDSVWSNLSTPAYSWIFNDENTLKSMYGAIYNYYTVLTGKLCPTGWHVPSNEEWEELIAYLGGGSVAGGKLKETGLTHWVSPNTDATNQSGFTALPGGYRMQQGSFWGVEYDGRWWSSTSGVIELTYNSGTAPDNITMSCSSECGMAVRCIKNP